MDHVDPPLPGETKAPLRAAYTRLRLLWLWSYVERIELPVARTLGGRRPYLYALGPRSVLCLPEHRETGEGAVSVRRWVTGLGVPDPGRILPHSVPDLLVSVPFALLAFWLIYKFLPNRAVGNRAAAAGAITATVGLVVSRPIFTMFISNSERNKSLYGSLLSVVVFALWMYVVAQLVLWGSHVAAQIDGAPMPRAPRAGLGYGEGDGG